MDGPIVLTLYMNPQAVGALAVVIGFVLIKTLIELIP